MPVWVQKNSESGGGAPRDEQQQSQASKSKPPAGVAKNKDTVVHQSQASKSKASAGGAKHKDAAVHESQASKSKTQGGAAKDKDAVADDSQASNSKTEGGVAKHEDAVVDESQVSKSKPPAGVAKSKDAVVHQSQASKSKAQTGVTKHKDAVVHQSQASKSKALAGVAKHEVVHEQASDHWQQDWDGWQEGWRYEWEGWQAGSDDGSRKRKYWEQCWDDLWKRGWNRKQTEASTEEGTDTATDNIEGSTEGRTDTADHVEGCSDSLDDRLDTLAAELKVVFPEGLQCSAKERDEKEFSLAQWKGAAILEMEMRLFVAGLPEGSRPSDAIRFASAAVQHASLSRLHSLLDLPVHREGSRKSRSEYVEALVWELKELGSNTVREMILRELVDITRGQMCPYPEEAVNIMRNWIRSFEVQWGYSYTHSSFRGEKDWCTSTGRLNVVNPRDLDKLYSFVAHFHRQAQPLCFVEMQTAHHHLCEDIDVRGKEDFLLPGKDMSFWQRRATVLQAMFPDVEPLKLTLFTASGWDRAKEEYKSSFHAIWNIVVDAETHAVVRSETIREFSKKSVNGWCETLAKSMMKASPFNTWEAVFDASAVVGGSARMPYCDKARRDGQRQIVENRVLLPLGVWEFHAAQGNRAVSVLGPKGATEEEWVKLGSSRQIDGDGNMFPLSDFVPPDQPLAAQVLRCVRRTARSSGSLSDKKVRQESRLQMQKQAWYDGQRHCRRIFRNECTYIDGDPPKSCASAFKKQLDEHMGDPDGSGSSLCTLAAKDGTERWLWNAKYLKGAVEVTIPVDQSSAKILVRGSKEQQAKFVEVLKQFTDPWEGDVPAFKKPAQTSTRPGRR